MKTLFLFFAILIGGCATAPTKQQVYEKVVGCTNTAASQALKAQAIECLVNSSPSNYASCLQPLAVTWTAQEIECVAGYYESANKSDSGVK